MSFILSGFWSNISISKRRNDWIHAWFSWNVLNNSFVVSCLFFCYIFRKFDVSSLTYYKRLLFWILTYLYNMFHYLLNITFNNNFIIIFMPFRFKLTEQRIDNIFLDNLIIQWERIKIYFLLICLQNTIQEMLSVVYFR